MERCSRIIGCSGLLLVLSAACGANGLLAQSPDVGASASTGVEQPGSVIRWTFGLGFQDFSSPDHEESGVGFHASVANSASWGVLALRASSVEEPASPKSPSLSQWDVGVLYGRELRADRWYLTLAAGVGAVGGMRRGRLIYDPTVRCTDLSFLCVLAALFEPVMTKTYERDPFVTAGIPFEVQAGRSGRLGVEANLFGNLNPVRSAVGVSFGFSINSHRSR